MTYGPEEFAADAVLVMALLVLVALCAAGAGAPVGEWLAAGLRAMGLS